MFDRTRAAHVVRNVGASSVLLLTFLLTVSIGAQQPVDLVIQGGWLFDGAGDSVERNRGIWIRGGKILGVRGEMPPTRGSEEQVIELGEDDYLLPGFFDLHAHYAMDLFGRGRVDETRAYPAIFLANGVTSTFPAGEVNPEEMRQLRLLIDNDEVPGPRIFNSGPYFGTARYGWNAKITPQEIREEVDAWAAKGARGFKAKGITAPHLEVLIDQAHRHGLTVTGHLGSGFQNSVNPRDAIRMGIDRVEHFLGGDALTSDRPAYTSLIRVAADSPEMKSIMELFIRHRVFFDATLATYACFGDADPEVCEPYANEGSYLTPYMQKVLEERGPSEPNERFAQVYRAKKTTVLAFYQAGGGDLITVGTDRPSRGEYLSGFSYHRELHALVRAGIPNAAVLKMATRNGAQALGIESHLGTIEPGKLADLIVVRGDPLEDIRNTRHVRLVIKAGVPSEPAKLLGSAQGKIGPDGPDEISDWVQWD